MRMVFVRHGEPDYEKDCLTEIGKKQAEAAAERLEREGIAEIYASPMGRASETAFAVQNSEHASASGCEMALNAACA